jgi:hypothetical protein
MLGLDAPGQSKKEAVEEFIKSKAAAIEVKGNELGAYSDIKELRRKAENWYREHLQGKSVHHEMLGEIKFTRKGADETLHNSAIEKIFLIPHLEKLITTGNAGEWQKPKHERIDGIVSFALIDNTVNLNGTHKSIGVFIYQDTNGNAYYDLFIKKSDTLAPDKGGAHQVSDSSIPEEEYEVNIFIKC